MYRPPTVLVALRDFKWAGAAITKGSTLTQAQFKAGKVSLLLSRGWVEALPETHARKGKPWIPTPTYVTPQALTKIKDSAGATCTLTGVVTGLDVRYTYVSNITNPTGLWINSGDGRTYNIANPATNYALNITYAPGSYTAKLIIWDGTKFATDTEAVTVTGSELLRGGSEYGAYTTPEQAKEAHNLAPKADTP